MADRIPKLDDIYIVVTHKSTKAQGSYLSILSQENFDFFVGTKQQLEQLQILKQSIVAVRLSPIFLRNELKLLTSKSAQKLGGIGYETHLFEKGLLAEAFSYFPKDYVDPAFTFLNRARKDTLAKLELKGLGGYLEAITTNFLHKKGITHIISPSDSSHMRKGQLGKGELKAGKEYSVKEWNKGMGRIIRRRINLPKRPL